MPRNNTRRSTATDKLVAGHLTSMEKVLLEALKQRLARVRCSSSAGTVEFLDAVSSGELDDLAARIVESDASKIDEIEQALTMLREGRYGICRQCGRRIREARLKARPFATLCVDCKRKEERAAAASRLAVHYRAAEISVDVDGSQDEEAEQAPIEDFMRESRVSESF